ncbi:Crp/Fnr family transcriptional regulator [Agrobacterium vitis]|uniref:Crp/Fnr family transcriptional regulator n=1 Tax=Agrobacterium vitis TaxID=373 RepID=UPI0012E9346E|nr:Crp/Fnr family transcriptional regulator [Agrobacterium vitis]MVA68839.1 helix-turn-helix domain-containing protein [Agrobacterium vitis]MVA87955.1 helix-turn-helix domain-containing protein [Agrobacterium vitis]
MTSEDTADTGMADTDMTDTGMFLAKADIFTSLTPEEDRAWSQLCTVESVSGGTIVLDYGIRPEIVLVVLSGALRATLRVSAGKELFLDMIGPGGTMAEMDAIRAEGYNLCLMATTDAMLVRMPVDVFNDIIAQKHTVCLSLLSVLVQRMHVLHARICEFSYLDVRHRLYTTLLRLSKPSEDKPQQRMISPVIIHAALAEHVGARRETVSREMSRLVQDGVIQRTRTAIVIRQPHALLRRLSQFDFS